MLNLTTPIVFIIFNRPETTAKVFEAIKKAKPKKLYVVADGPRLDKKGEFEKCAVTRSIIDKVDWDCEVFKNYSDVNLGCGKRVSSGLNWVFENETEAIILEDDCLPAQSFFQYCQELLERYSADIRIMHICGSNFTPERKRNEDSYFFTRYAHIWGWATWRRAWQKYDYEIKLWPIFREGGWLKESFDNQLERKNVIRDYNNLLKYKIDTWDYQWGFTILCNSGLSICPRENLITNIGVQGIHANGDVSGHMGRNVDESFSIKKHPDFIIRDNWYDTYHFRKHLKISLSKRMLTKIKTILKKMIFHLWF